MNWRRAALLALTLVPALWALYAGFGRDPHAVPSMLVGKLAPSLRLVDLDGRTVDLAELRGRPVLLNFWATWCYPCQAEHALLQQTARAHRGELAVFGVIYQDDADNVRRYLRTNPSPYAHLVDPGSQAAIDYGVAGVPESFFIDRAGVVTYKHAGALHPAIVQQALTRILAPASAPTPTAEAQRAR